MGAFLDKPRTEKQSEAGHGMGLRYGISSMQGWRIEMEDAHCAKIGLPYGLDQWSFFAVFDGHAGPKVSAHSADNLLDTILQGIQQQFPSKQQRTDHWSDVGGGGDGGGGGVGGSSGSTGDNGAQDEDMKDATTTTTTTTTTNTTTTTEPFQNSGKAETSPPSETQLATTIEIVPAESETLETTTTKEKNNIDTTTNTTPATAAPDRKTDDSTITTSSATQQQEPLNTNHHKKTDITEMSQHPFTLITSEQLEQVKKAIHDGFLQLDAKMRVLPGEDRSGSTAVCAMISPTHLFFANCGDSRAVLSREGKAYFSTEDHKPMNPGERDRIQKAGGSVMIQRVNGSLAVSRALGDFEYKQVEGKGPCEQLVSPEPEVTIESRDEGDEFLVLACDGIFDVMSNEELCDFVRHQLRVHKDLEYICSSVIDTCLHKGSRDNMSIVLVVFEGAPRVTKEAIEEDEKLNRQIEQEVEDILKEDPSTTLAGVMNNLVYTELKYLPPGGGLDSKRKVIEDVINRIRPEQ